MKHTLLMLMTGLTLACSQMAFANGTLTHLSGQVSVEKADGATLAGAAGMQVVPGDTLMTGANGFARMETTDGGEMVLRPDSQMKIEKYNFDVNKPADDSFVFKVLKGGFRTVTGLISKRGNREAYQGKTETATIGIRGTQYDLRVCAGGCGALPDGTYVAVRFGAVATGNSQGSMDLKAGQVGRVPANQPPVLLPRDPGVGFTPPASIPKLDEKKKQQQQQADAKTQDKAQTKSGAATDKPAAASTDKPAAEGNSDKPAAEGSKEKSSTGSADKPSAAEGSKSTASSDGTGNGSSSGGASSSASTSGTPTSTVSTATPAASTPSCSIQ